MRLHAPLEDECRRALIQLVSYRLAILEAMRCIEWILVKDHMAVK